MTTILAILNWLEAHAKAGGLKFVLTVSGGVTLTVVALTIGANQAAGVVPPGIDTVTVQKVIAPASPGLARAVDICKFGTVSRQLTDNGTGFAYTAIFGLDVMRWPDDPPGKNPLAIVNGETVMLSEDVMKCLTGKF